MKFKALFFAAVAFFALPFVSTANAQVVSVPCGAFSNSPFVCVNNQSNWPVSYIDCDGFRVSIVSDGGFLPPRSTGVAKFRQPYCTRVVIYTMDGRSRVSSFIDAKNTTTITISDWRW